MGREDVPLVMVGAGAGVAPFRAFCNELQASPSRSSPAVLLFGCQHPDRDWLYRTEMTSLLVQNARGNSKHNQPLSQLLTAFSRVGEEGVYDPSGCCGEYVQTVLKAKGTEIRDWLMGHGIIYVCGSKGLCQGVLKTLGEVVAGGDTEVQRLREQGSIIQECWGERPLSLKLEYGSCGGSVPCNCGSSASALASSVLLLEAAKNSKLMVR